MLILFITTNKYLLSLAINRYVDCHVTLSTVFYLSNGNNSTGNTGFPNNFPGDFSDFFFHKNFKLSNCASFEKLKALLIVPS